MFEIGISQNMKCDNSVGFPKLGQIHIYVVIYMYVCMYVTLSHLRSKAQTVVRN